MLHGIHLVDPPYEYRIQPPGIMNSAINTCRIWTERMSSFQIVTKP
jgi:hypothetical protein